MNLDKGIYYYTTYENSRITAIDMAHENLESAELISFPMTSGQQMHRIN